MPLENGNGSNGMVMPVAPMGYGGYPMMGSNFGGGFGGFGGDWGYFLLLLLLCGGGWGGFGMGGWGGMMGMDMMGGFGLYPWLNNSQNINDGFRDQQLSNQVGNIQNAVTSGFGDMQTALCSGFGNVQNSLCQGFAGVNQNISNTAAQGEIAANGRHNALTGQLYNGEINALNRSFAEQTANQQGFNGVGTGIADLKYTVATENCLDRTAAAQNTRDIIDSQTRGTQAILDKLCALELDGVKGQLATAQRENVALQNALNMATMRESQTAQTAAILQGQNAEVDALYNRLSNCPVPSTPVYGRTPIFTCNGGCNGNGVGFAA